MANKFTKSVLERQAKEAKEAKEIKAVPVEIKKPEPEKKPEPTIITPDAVEPVKKRAAATAAAPRAASASVTPAAAPKAVKNAASAMDLSAFIIRDAERTAKNKTFYLDAAVIEGIKACAAAQKVTDSKLVNDILKKILGV